MEGAAHAIVSNVGQLVGEEFRQLRGVGGEVARLRDELATMNALLRMQSEAEEGAVDHFVREWMKQLREVGYDAQDCVDLYLFRVRTRSGDRLIGWCKRHLKTLLCRHRLAGDIRALRAHAAAVNEQHARYGVSLEALRHPPSSLSAVRASAHVLRLAVADGPNKLVGITEQAIFLADKVIAPSDTTDLKVFSVVGFGGLGKTTLVMEVCRHLESHFQRRAQVSVSQVLDLKALLRSVLHQILEVHAADSANNPIQPPADIDGMDTENLHQNIKTILKEKSSASAPQTRLQTLLRSLDSDGSGRISEKDLKRLNLLDEYTLFDEDGETKSLSAMRTPATPSTRIAGRPSSESWNDFILYLDSGASGNAVFNAAMLINRRDPPAGTNQFTGADGSRMAVIGFGDIKMENFRIPDVYLVQGLTVNLISVGQLASNHKVCCCFAGNECNLMLSDGSRIGGAIRCDDNQYMLRFLQIE